MAKYQFNADQMNKTFDSMFGAGSYSAGIADAERIGRGIGLARLEEERRKEEERQRKKAEAILEAAKKEAAKQKREADKKKEKEKKSGKKETKLSKENENKKKRLKEAGVDPDQDNSIFGKAAGKLHFEKDQNLFWDALELMDRPRNAVANVLLGDAEHGKYVKAEVKKQEKKLGRKLTFDEKVKAIGKAQQKMIKDGKDESYSKRIKDGLTGKKKVSGSDILEKSFDMEKGLGRAAAGFGVDVMLDPLNLVGGGAARLAEKGIRATSLGNKALDTVGAAKKATKEATKAGLKKIPGVEASVDFVDEIFSGKRKKSKTLDGGKSDELLNLERDMENKRLFMQDESANAVAKAMNEAGDFSGNVIGKEMERPLMQPRPLDITSAPNVLSKQGILSDQFGKVEGVMDAMKMNPSAPLSKPLETLFKTTDNSLNSDFKFNKSQKIDPSSGNKVDAGKYGEWGTDGQVDLGAYGQWGKKYDVETEVHRIVSRPDVPVEQAAIELAKHPSIKSAAETLINSNAELRKFAADNGIELTDIEGYMAHYLTKEARKKLDEAGESVSDGVVPVGGNKKVFKRELHDSVENINRKKGMEFFNPDAFVATAGGQHRMINAIVRESVKKQVLENANFAREIPLHKKPRKGFVELTVDGKKYEITSGAKQVITNFEKNVTEEGIKKILNGFDKLQNMWKKTALFSAGFHARNYLGNAWNMHLTGMRPDEIIAEQLKATDNIIQAGKKLTGKEGKIADKDLELYNEFRQEGLKNTGSMADFKLNPEDDLMSNIRYKTKSVPKKIFHEIAEIGKADGAWNKVKQAVDSPFATSRRMGDVADETARLALYKWARKKGMSRKEAAAKVRETLFDYTELTPTEQQLFKRVAPFYTWLRKNSEFQMKSFLKNPEKFNRIQLAENNAQDNIDLDEQTIPDYLKNNMAIPIPGLDRMLSVGLPAADLAKWAEPGKVLMDSLSPIPKVLMELYNNQKTFNGAPIENFEGEKKKFLGMDLPAGVAYGLEQISPLRRASNFMEGGGESKTATEGVLDLLGGNLAPKIDREGYQQQFDYKEKKRLDDLIKKTEKQDGKDVPTLAEMKKAGIPIEEEDKQTQKELSSLGLSDDNVRILMNLKKKVYNNNAEYAAKVAEALQANGVPAEAIDIVTREYLEY